MRKLALLLVILITLLLTVGWSNGNNSGNGFGTHDWILKEAWDALGRPKWLNYKVARYATDDPDTRYRDFRHHVYDRWGKHYGDAPDKVDELFDQAVQALREGRNKRASTKIGLLSHYYSDINNPLHTDSSRAEKRMHSSYERAVNTRTNRADERVYRVKYDGKNNVPNPSRFTKTAARSAHKSYTTLVSEYRKNGFNSRVNRITRGRLNRAANGLADIIYVIKKKSKEPAPATSGNFIGNLSSKLLHNAANPECQRIFDSMNPANKVNFNSEAEGIAAGYRPCGCL